MEISEERLQMMLENSYQNFHVRGFDYLCIKRTEGHTRKVYFFDGDVAHLSEVVSPHDHRYHFKTRVLAGAMSNSLYEPDSRHGVVYNEFEWHTPLLGGDGFHWRREIRLFETQRLFYRPGETYDMHASELHTIRMHSDTTVLVLDQFDDVVPVGQPTRTFMRDRQPPSLDGLYERFAPDGLLCRLGQYQELARRRS